MQSNNSLCFQVSEMNSFNFSQSETELRYVFLSDRDEMRTFHRFFLSQTILLSQTISEE
jgi:hypothetical protein